MVYLTALAFAYLVFLLARRADRRARQAFAARLGAMYRMRSEFWRLCEWARDARERGDVEAAARFGEQAQALLPIATGDAAALRLDDPILAGEIGWTAGMLDDELRDMGRAVATADLREFDRWITGRGRRPVEWVINPPPTLEDDGLSRRIHRVIGGVVGAGAGLVAWLQTFWRDTGVNVFALVVFVLVGAVATGYLAGVMRDELWYALMRGIRYRGWGRRTRLS